MARKWIVRGKLVTNLRKCVKAALQVLKMRCPHLEQYLCNFADECRVKGPPKFCAYHVLQQERYRPLLEDASKEGYWLYGVEYILRLLNERDYDVLYNNTSLKTSSQNISFSPSPRERLDDLVSDIGASSLAECPAKIILRKYVKPPDAVKQLLEIGSLMHEVINGDFGNEYKNQFEFSKFPIRRSEYCELSVLYELEGIKVGGRIDCLLVANMNGREIPAIVDFKRSEYRRYETTRYLVQLGTYKLGLGTEEALLITIKRNKGGYPTPTINYVDDEFDEWLKGYILKKFRGIAQVLQSGKPECQGCEMEHVCEHFNFCKLQNQTPWNKFLKFL